MTSIEQEAKDFLNKKGSELQPVALQCSRCSKWSGYNIENNNTLPKGWRETKDGYVCNDWRKKGNIKRSKRTAVIAPHWKN